MLPQLIVIRGPLGVGKSTVAKLLSGHLHGTYFAIDEVLKAQNLDVAKDGGGIPLQNFLKVNEYLTPQIRARQQNNLPVIIEGNFYYKQQLDNLLQNNDGVCAVFTLKASLKTCIARDSERSNPHGPDAAKAVYAMVSAFDYGTVIDTEGNTPKETTEALFKLLRVN